MMPRFPVWMTGLVELQDFEVGGGLRREVKILLGLE